MQPGLYEQLLTITLQDASERLASPQLYSIAPVDAEESHSAVAQFLEHVLVSSVARFHGSDAAERQRRLVDRVVTSLVEESENNAGQQLSIATPLRRLLAIHASSQTTPVNRPDTPLSRSALLTGTRLDPSLGSRKEIGSADRVDILCSFIRWSGLRILMDDLRQLTSQERVTAIRRITSK